MPTRSLIAFTGGLDSTYVLHEELKKGHSVEVVYINVTQNDTNVLAELTARRRILTHFYKLFPGQISNEWVVLDAPLRVTQGGKSDRAQLIQQYGTMNGLISVILQADKDVNYRPMTGWHYQDVMENNPDELQSEYTYTFYKEIFKALVHSVEPERAIVCGLTTPAWNVDKRVMWDSLDEWTRLNLSVGYSFYTETKRNGTVVLEDRTTFKKAAEYKRMGITPSRHASSHIGLLTPLDRYFLGSVMGLGDGVGALLEECEAYYRSFRTQPVRAVNLEWLGVLIDRFRVSND